MDSAVLLLPDANDGGGLFIPDGAELQACGPWLQLCVLGADQSVLPGWGELPGVSADGFAEMAIRERDGRYIFTQPDLQVHALLAAVPQPQELTLLIRLGEERQLSCPLLVEDRQAEAAEMRAAGDEPQPGDQDGVCPVPDEAGMPDAAETGTEDAEERGSAAAVQAEDPAPAADAPQAAAGAEDTPVQAVQGTGPEQSRPLQAHEMQDAACAVPDAAEAGAEDAEERGSAAEPQADGGAVHVQEHAAEEVPAAGGHGAAQAAAGWHQAADADGARVRRSPPEAEEEAQPDGAQRRSAASRPLRWLFVAGGTLAAVLAAISIIWLVVPHGPDAMTADAGSAGGGCTLSGLPDASILHNCAEAAADDRMLLDLAYEALHAGRCDLGLRILFSRGRAGLGEASYYLATAYDEHSGTAVSCVTKDRDTAIYWYEKARLSRDRGVEAAAALEVLTIR